MPTHRTDIPALRPVGAPAGPGDGGSHGFSLTLSGLGMRLGMVGVAAAVLWLGLYLVVG